jgi:hypothetical protein
VTPWIALGVMFQGVYIVGSIGLVITKRTKRYPFATGTAVVVNLVANTWLVPRYGMLGAAWANALAYGTLTVVTTSLSWQAYSIPYEWSRLARIVVAGAAGFALAGRVAPEQGPALAGVLIRGSVMVVTYVGMLFLTRFFHGGELRVLNDVRRRVLARRRAPARERESVPSEMAGEMVAPVSEGTVDPEVSGRTDRPDQPDRGSS